MKTKKWWGIISLGIILVSMGYLIWGGMEKNFVYFVTPSELLAKGKAAFGTPIRLGGVVSEHPVFSAGTLSFDLHDNQGHVRVITTKTPPQMFHPGIGVVVEGMWKPDETFYADRLMVKHGNEYHPPKKGEMPQEIYQQLQRKP